MDTSKIDTDPLEYPTRYYAIMGYREFIQMIIDDLVLAA